ncbi:Gfo/Idh/MocA family protein [Brevibacillus sp. BC25]|uniref:Gfo/Idh/MocA family protein n=1 Tax=Brevibacillus sp. BC25 TaxID=1144308 RepID=UPI00027146E4|nr:Gfo/Idh/MocA family oxidoreductase [Brevibacillus sp. BC25]EJL30563.1 putative dehydrogenase [Brevibacillus sp. BC25]
MISLGIVGTGTIAPFYISAINWLNKNNDSNIRVSAAVNRTRESNERAKHELKIPRTYSTIVDMLENEKLDGVIIAVPASQIYDVTSALIPYQVPLLIEKPPGLTAQQTKSLEVLSKQHGTSIMVGFNRRFYSVVNQAKNVIEEAGGLLGMRMDVFERYRSLRENNYPPEKLEMLFTGNSIHCIDLIRYYCGDPKRVNAFHNSQDVEPFNHRYAALIVSESNIPVTFQAYWHALGNWNYELYIPDGKIQFTNLEEAHVFLRNKEPYRLLPEVADVNAKPGFANQILYFIRNVVTHSKGAVYEGSMSIQDAARTMQLVESLSPSTAECII